MQRTEPNPNHCKKMESEKPYTPQESKCEAKEPISISEDIEETVSHRDLNFDLLDFVNIRHLEEIIYNNAVSHGFHNNHTSMEHDVMMIITELCEAVNAHRARKIFPQNLKDVIDMAIEDKKIEPNTSLDSFYSDLEKRRASVIGAYEEYIQGTFTEELADAYIRCIDYIAYHQLDKMVRVTLDSRSSVRRTLFENQLRGLTLPHMIHVVIRFYYKGDIYDPTILLLGISSIANIFKIELRDFINAKIIFNINRPILHGKQY